MLLFMFRSENKSTVPIGMYPLMMPPYGVPNLTTAHPPVEWNNVCTEPTAPSDVQSIAVREFDAQ